MVDYSSLLVNENRSYLVEVKLMYSYGIGVFANQFIPKGTPVFKFIPEYSLKLSREEYDLLPPTIKIFPYSCKLMGDIFLNLDIARFENHSDNPTITNVEWKQDYCFAVATRDIHPGIEITSNYKTYDFLWEEKLKMYSGIPDRSLVGKCFPKVIL